jgi:hypothetical protein
MVMRMTRGGDLLAQRRRTHDRERIVGTVDERLLLLRIAKEILTFMRDVHHELDIDIEALQHVRLCFLREPCNELMGYCSYSNSRPYYSTKYQVRHGAHRILINRLLLHEDIVEAVRTVHHELLHSVLGSAEGHGDTFQIHEDRFKSIANEVVARIGGVL